MAFAPVKLLSRRCRAASALLAAVVLLSAPLCAEPERAEPRSVLLFPVNSHWLSRPIADRFTDALGKSLAADGCTVVRGDPDAPLFRDNPPPEGLSEEEVRSWYGVLAGADACLAGKLSEGAGEVAVEMEFEGVVSEKKAALREAVAVKEDRDRAVQQLAERVATALTDEVWAQAGADEEGRKQGAAARYAQGREAAEQGKWAEASRHFEAAIAGDPQSAEYFAAAAEAMWHARGDAAGALVRIRRAVRLAPDEISYRLQEGELALRAGQAEAALAAFRAAHAADPEDLRAIEGMARAARAGGSFDAAVSYYRQLVEQIPELADEPPSLPQLLAGMRGDVVRITGPRDALPQQIALVYLSAGETLRGVGRLLAYHQRADRPAYGEEEYRITAQGLDAESEVVARQAQVALSEYQMRDASAEEAGDSLEILHRRSDALATLGERITPPPSVEAAHRYRTLAYQLLNQSNFEALLYINTGDRDHLRRAEFWSKAYREALDQARGLAAFAAASPEGP